ncbi:M15 family metallopeptidase [Tahibacter harae]|uniref:M15 family metallopeptidase n=1 Tax=Tahibacter harae TaxID=2963937 RepID=A0ABT1QSP9_9GAMM|nr:M15 family metallopeptidase [Tahibacter harae]MCQ4165323.1 M15 family metallopeptidase [Tahibacter harae]
MSPRRNAAPPTTPPPDLQPPVRADTALRAQLRQRARELGIPADYGRQRRLAQVREPRELAFVGYDIHQRPQWLAPRAARAWLRLRHAAALGQVELQLVSAFRSVEYQVGLIERKLARGQAMAQILQVSAAPGYSEHHSGRALDLTTPGFAALEEEFEHSPAFRWLQHNAADYGFRLSFPRGNPHGIAYEPWHWCWHAAPRA